MHHYLLLNVRLLYLNHLRLFRGSRRISVPAATSPNVSSRELLPAAIEADAFVIPFDTFYLIKIVNLD